MKNRICKKIIKIAVIGTGRIAFLLEKDKLRYKPCTHIGALLTLINKSNAISFDYLCDIKQDRLKQIKAFLQKKKIDVSKTIFTHDYKTIQYNLLDLLVIASDTHTHFDILKLGLIHNVPKIVIEKPILMNISEVQKIKKLIKSSSSKIWINYERRFHSTYNDIHKIINEKSLGKPLYYNGYFITKYGAFHSKKENEGLLLHDTTHLLDIIQYFFGTIKTRRQIISGDNIHNLYLLHKNKINGIILTIKNTDYFHFEIQIIFEKGRISAGNGFYYIELSAKSNYYANFNSLNINKKNLIQKITINENPFVKLYLNVLNGNDNANDVNDALTNVEILSS